MKNRFIVLLAGLFLGVLAGCGDVTQGEVQGDVQGEPAQIDPQTQQPFCYMCPVAPGHTESMATRQPVLNEKTGQYICFPCEPTNYCGDGICEYPENSTNCSYDCGPAPTPYCGDYVCNNGETCSSCSFDCGSCPVTPYCGDGVCNGTETCSSCSGDCGTCPTGPTCGDGICEYPETRLNCRADCYIQTCIYACP